MAGEDNQMIPTDMAHYLQSEAKRLSMEVRKPGPSKAADIMGPNFGPRAVHTMDITSEAQSFNGMWIAPPGALGSPDPTKWVAGITVADADVGGFQFASTFLPEEAPWDQWIRGIRAIRGAGRVHEPWRGLLGDKLPTIGANSHLTRTASYNNSNGVWTYFQATQASEDLRGVMTTLQGRVTINRSGTYMLSCAAEHNANAAANNVGVRIIKINTSETIQTWYAGGGANQKAFPGGSMSAPLSAGDRLEMQTAQWRASTVTVLPAGTYFNIAYMG